MAGLEPMLHASASVAFVGVVATLVLDAWALLLRRVFGIRSLDWALVGRWLGHFRHGRFVHAAGIATASAVRGERLLGWVFHYAVGIVFAALLFAAMGSEWARNPTVLPCLAIGLLTMLFPWFVMQPAIGAGIAASRTPNPAQARLRSLATHVVFGLGLYVATVLAATLWR